MPDRIVEAKNEYYRSNKTDMEVDYTSSSMLINSKAIKVQ